jgi:ligand-binding SRPBCC domain-containing protein
VLAFEYSSHIDAPVERVFAFHERPDALELLSPADLRPDILRRTGGIEVGATVELRVPFGPLKLRWIAHHIGYEKNRLFIDEQREGPFAAWVHAHVFTAEGGGTRLTDSIEFAMRGGAVVERIAGWLIRRKLRGYFEYRHAITRQLCESTESGRVRLSPD